MNINIVKEFMRKYGVSVFPCNILSEEDDDEFNDATDKEKEHIEEVKEATNLTSEIVHGGNEATKDIINSPNSANNGIKDKSSEKEGNKGENKGEGSNKNTKSGIGNNKKDKEGNGLGNKRQDGEVKISCPVNKIKENIDNILDNRKDFNYQVETTKEATDKMVAIIKTIAKRHKGFYKSFEGGSLYDANNIARHLITNEFHLIPKDKYKKSNAKIIEFYIDTSMSVFLYKQAIISAIQLLEKQGYKCILRGCGNGFWHEDCSNDSYNVRNTLESFGVGTVPNICRVTETTAIKLCNKAEFSVIIADFDGLSSIVRVARGCNKDKVPYLLSTENRYSWDYPTEHNWVESEYDSYDMQKVFDISYVSEEEEDDDDYYYEDEDDYEDY